MRCATKLALILLASLALVTSMAGGAAAAEDPAVGMGLGSAAAKRVKCPKGTVAIKLNKRAACLRKRDLPGRGKPVSVQRARESLVSRATSARTLRALLGRKGARVIGGGAKSLRRLALEVARDKPPLARSRRARRVRASEFEPMRAPAGQVGSGGSGSQSTTNAAGVTSTVRIAQSAFVPECPDTKGNLDGTLAAGLSMEQRGPIREGTGRKRFEMITRIELKGTVEGHVGSNAKLRDYDLDAVATMTARLRVLGPAGLEHLGTTDPYKASMRISITGLRPGSAPDASNVRVSMSDPGPRDIAANGQGVISSPHFTGAAGGALAMARAQVDRAFEDAEKIYHDNAECLSARFDPDTFSAAVDEDVPIGVTVSDRAGGRVSMELKSDPTAARVSPASDTTSESKTAKFTVTPEGSADYAGLGVTGTSVRGRVFKRMLGNVTRADIYLFEVTLAGTGSYTEDSGETGVVERHYRDENFTFTSGWPSVIVPADGKPPGSPNDFHAFTGEVAGGLHNYGSHYASGSSFNCTGQLAPGNPANNHFVVGPPAGGSVPLTINGFWGLGSGGGTCTKTGTWFSSPQPTAAGTGGNDIASGSGATVNLTPQQLARTSFTVPLSSRPFPAQCAGGNGGNFYCNHTLTWNATVTFRRKATCKRFGGSYGCGGPASAKRGY